MRILPTITTTRGSDWRAKIEEARLLGLTEVAFFPTVLVPDERQEAYALLKEKGITKIPFVHLRTDDLETSEIDLLINDFQTEVFNIHPAGINPVNCDLSPYARQIYLETQRTLNGEELKNYAGICVDISHVENFEKTNPEVFANTIDLLKHFPIGCAHISAVRSVPEITPEKTKWAFHHFESLSDFDYVKKYQAMLPSIVALELENTLTEQLQAKSYILNLLQEEN